MLRAVFFTVVAFGVSWSIWYAGAPHVEGQAKAALAVAYMFGPLVAALATALVFDRRRVAAVLGWRWRADPWWLLAWVAAPAVAFAAVWASTLAPGVEYQSYAVGLREMLTKLGRDVPADLEASLPGLPALIGLAMLGGILPNAIAAFGEEGGWRGVLWSALRGFGFWKASVLVGVLWGVWHAPLILEGHNYGTGYPGFPWTGVAMMTAFCVSASPLLGFLRDRTASSVPAAIFHGTLNAIGGVTVLMLAGGGPWLSGIAGFPGIAVFALVAAAIALMRPNRPPKG